MLVKFVDVQAVGPKDSLIGFASLNLAVKNAISVSDAWYKITEIIGYLALLIAGCFAIIGLIQLIKRKSIKKVDKNLLVLCVLYVAVMAFYVLFEVVVINYRPIIIEGELEASYPSSHTMLSLAIFVSAIPLLKGYIKNSRVSFAVMVVFAVLAAIMPVGRLLSGVHWFTDIIGSVLLTSSLLTAYFGFVENA
jgi:undecaprenyl-diphosphatase